MPRHKKMKRIHQVLYMKRMLCITDYTLYIQNIIYYSIYKF